MFDPTRGNKKWDIQRNEHYGRAWEHGAPQRPEVHDAVDSGTVSLVTVNMRRPRGIAPDDVITKTLGVCGGFLRTSERAVVSEFYERAHEDFGAETKSRSIPASGYYAYRTLDGALDGIQRQVHANMRLVDAGMTPEVPVDADCERHISSTFGRRADPHWVAPKNLLVERPYIAIDPTPLKLAEEVRATGADPLSVYQEAWMDSRVPIADDPRSLAVILATYGDRFREGVQYRCPSRLAYAASYEVSPKMNDLLQRPFDHIHREAGLTRDERVMLQATSRVDKAGVFRKLKPETLHGAAVELEEFAIEKSGQGHERVAQIASLRSVSLSRQGLELEQRRSPKTIETVMG